MLVLNLFMGFLSGVIYQTKYKTREGAKKSLFGSSTIPSGSIRPWAILRQMNLSKCMEIPQPDFTVIKKFKCPLFKLFMTATNRKRGRKICVYFLDVVSVQYTPQALTVPTY
jgi:hypothetical protein